MFKRWPNVFPLFSFRSRDGTRRHPVREDSIHPKFYQFSAQLAINGHINHAVGGWGREQRVASFYRRWSKPLLTPPGRCLETLVAGQS